MRALVFAFFAGVLLNACESCPKAPPPQTRVIDTACTWVMPMSASSSDTPETKREVIAYEIARQKNCPPKTAAPINSNKGSSD